MYTALCLYPNFGAPPQYLNLSLLLMVGGVSFPSLAPCQSPPLDLFLPLSSTSSQSLECKGNTLMFTLLIGSAQVGRMDKTLSLPAPLDFLTRFFWLSFCHCSPFSLFPCHLIFPIALTLATFCMLMSPKSTQHRLSLKFLISMSTA